MVNKKYNMLTVIKKDYEKSKKLNKIYYVCKCDCGVIKSIYINDVYNDKTKSCGCNKPKQYKDLKNKKFGKLSVLSYQYTKNKKSYWLCKCDCGSDVIVQGGNLSNGHTETCGCSKFSDGSNINLVKHFRNILINKIKECLVENEYKCCITGSSKRLEVHHTVSFSDLIQNTFDLLNLPILNNIYEYDINYREIIDKTFLDLHTDESLVVLSKDVHVLFHKKYKYINNTIEQFIEFKNNFN